MTKAELFLFVAILTLLISCGDNDPFSSSFQTTPNEEIDSTNEESQIELVDIELSDTPPTLTRLADLEENTTPPTGEGCNYTGNILKNGSFENLDERIGIIRNKSLLSLSENSTWDVFTGLPSLEDESKDSWELINGAGIEAQSNGVTTNTPRGNISIELDSHGENSNSSISQTLSLCQGIYKVSFIYYARSAETGDNNIIAQINDLKLVEVDLKNSNEWVHVSQIIKVNNPGDYDLILSSAGKANTIGALIDDISITKGQ